MKESLAQKRILCGLYIFIFAVILFTLCCDVSEADESHQNFHLYAFEFDLPSDYPIIESDASHIKTAAYKVSIRGCNAISIPPSFYMTMGADAIKDLLLSRWNDKKEQTMFVYKDREEFYGTCFAEDDESIETLFIHFPFVLSLRFHTDKDFALRTSSLVYDSISWDTIKASTPPQFEIDEFQINVPEGWYLWDFTDDELTFTANNGMFCGISHEASIDKSYQLDWDYGLYCSGIIAKYSAENGLDNRKNYSYNGIYTCREENTELGSSTVFFLHGNHVEKAMFTFSSGSIEDRYINELFSNITISKDFNDSKVYKPGYFAYDIPIFMVSVDHDGSLLYFRCNYAPVVLNITELNAEHEETAKTVFLKPIQEKGKVDEIINVNGIDWFIEEQTDEVDGTVYYTRLITYYSGKVIGMTNIVAAESEKHMVDYICTRFCNATYLPLDD